MSYSTSAKLVLKENYCEYKLYYNKFGFNYSIYNYKKTAKNVKDGKYLSSYYRTKSKIRELIECNLSFCSRFVTLTYADNMLDYKKAQNDFNNCLRRIKEDLGQSLSYIAVKEHQKRGSIHYHLITFNLDKIDFSKYWYGGFVHHKNITDLDFSRLTNYFVGYLTKKKKDYKQIEKGYRIFGYSKDLKKYTVIKRDYDFLQNNPYLHKVKDYDNSFGGNEKLFVSSLKNVDNILSFSSSYSVVEKGTKTYRNIFKAFD